MTPWHSTPPDVDGRALPPTPMPPELAATVDPARESRPAPPDDPAELARRLRVLDDIRAGRAGLRTDREETR